MALLKCRCSFQADAVCSAVLVHSTAKWQEGVAVECQVSLLAGVVKDRGER